ncbi:hypothetical protein KAR91_79560 [Candidatus Pacearchaeota archaeon]|nr:hypothetical protein [Candidatus Pacearchaeota archaeon]
MDIRKCTKCKEEIGLDNFCKNKALKDGVNSTCKACMKAYKKGYRATKAGKTKEATSGKVWYDAHREEQVESFKEYRKKNLKKVKCKQRDWYEDNKEHTLARMREYYQTHKAEVRTLNARYRAKKLQATPSWVNFDKIKEFYKEAQLLTEKTGIPHEVDHVYPLRGKICCGLHTENNLQVITMEENRNKSAKMPEDFYADFSLILNPEV